MALVLPRSLLMQNEEKGKFRLLIQKKDLFLPFPFYSIPRFIQWALKVFKQLTTDNKSSL